jgi:hypothetical protein
MNKISSLVIPIVLLLASNIALAQSDSTNLPGLSTIQLTTPTTTSGSGVPNPAALDAVTTYTETEVEPCPSGYYANGPVPADGTNVAAENVTGGVIYDQTVTTDRYGTTTYGGWTEVNFLCTQIPPAPTCPTGETEVSVPYWDSTTNQWVGIVCANPVTTATQMAACQAAMPTPPSTGGNGGINLFSIQTALAWGGGYGSNESVGVLTMTGASSISNFWNPMIASMNNLAPSEGCWGSTVSPWGSRPSASDGTTYDMPYFEIYGQDLYGNNDVGFGEACWLQQGTNNVVYAGGAAMYRNPGTCH